MSPIEKKILSYLDEHQAQGWVSPTQVGMFIGGKNIHDAGTWAKKVCGELIDKGLIEKNELDQYRITMAGEDLISEK